jgi:nucleoside phosphorylase/predicted negative regulator of RcsB-dependent stress response
MPAIEEVRGTVDVGILAVHAEEIDALYERLPEWAGAARGAREYDLRHAGEGGLVAICRGWSGDHADAARTAAAMIEDLAPAWLIVIGVASAVPGDEPSLGDVVVPTSVLDRAAEAVLEDGSHTFAAAPMHPDAAALAEEIPAKDLGCWASTDAIGRAPPSIDLSLKSFHGTKKTKAEVHAILRRRAEAGARAPRLVTGALLTSEAALDEAELLRVWQRAPRRFRAVEVETAGVWSVAHGHGVPMLAVRGIADVIGARRKARWTELARHAAASFTVALIRSGALRRPRSERQPCHDGAASGPKPRPAGGEPDTARRRAVEASRAGETLAEAAQLARLGDAALERGDVDEASARYAEALPLFRAVGDVRGEASGALRFGEIALRRGDLEGARRRYAEALPLFRRVSDALGEANCVARLGDLALKRGDADEARHRYQDALPLYRRAGDVLGEANCVLRLGDLALKRGDPDEARDRFEEALAIYARIPEPYSMGLTHRRLARLAPDERLRRRHNEAARELWVRAGRHDMVAKIDQEGPASSR